MQPKGRQTSNVDFAFVPDPANSNNALCKPNKINSDPGTAGIKTGGSTTNMRAYLTLAHEAWLENLLCCKLDPQQPLVATDGTLEVGPA